MYEEVLTFWFKEIKDAHWKKDKAIDILIKNKFATINKDGKEGRLDQWTDTPRGMLALIIVLDQFSRNIYRDTLESFSGDKKALELTLKGIKKGFDRDLAPDERSFFYMPLMHSEDIKVQEKSIQQFEDLAKEGVETITWARLHKDVIDKFGRFPHRNIILGRESTRAEKEYLSKGGGF